LLLNALAVLLERAPAPRRRQAPAAPEAPLPDAETLRAILGVAQDNIAALLRARIPDVRVWHIGTFEIHPDNLAFYVATKTDTARDRLRQDHGVATRCRDILRDAGYPAASARRTPIVIESDETVIRDWGGWWQFMK
jgi:hypothetical protein